MIIETTAGKYTLTRNPNTNKIRVTANNDGAMRSIFYALKLSGAEEGFPLPEWNDEDQSLEVELSEGTAAIWVQFEVLNYVDYTTFERKSQNEIFMAADCGTTTWTNCLAGDVL